MWFSLSKTHTFMRKCVFSLVATSAPPQPPTDHLGGVPGTLSDAFFLTKLYMRKKCRKVASACSPEAAKRPKLLPGAPKMPPKSMPERVRRGFQSRFRMKTSKCHETSVFIILTIRAPPKTTFFNDFRIRNGVKKHFERKCP